jgi:CIC family chloride channel protein
MNAPLLGSTVVASVASVVVERSILGNEPLFHVPTYHLVHPAELLAYAVLGVIGGGISLVFSKGLLGLRRLFQDLPGWSRVLHPAMGGVLIGATLIYVPAVMGVGYQYVDQALNGGLLLKTMALLCVVKLAATIVSYASGNAGGIFAPSLYIGAMAGGAVGLVVGRIAPFPTAEPGAYALVGMGTLFAGIIRAPMTSVFMIFEITQDYQILVPLMLANMLSFMISKRFQPIPVYHALLLQDDVHLPSAETRLAPAARSARAIMETEMTLLPPEAPIEEIWRIAAGKSAPAYLVGDRDRLFGVVTRERLLEAVASGQSANSLRSIIDDGFVHAHADHPLDIVLERFSQSPGILPIVSRTNATHIEGIITRDSILRLADRPAKVSGRRGHESNPPATGDEGTPITVGQKTH